MAADPHASITFSNLFDHGFKKVIGKDVEGRRVIDDPNVDQGLRLLWKALLEFSSDLFAEEIQEFWNEAIPLSRVSKKLNELAEKDKTSLLNVVNKYLAAGSKLNIPSLTRKKVMSHFEPVPGEDKKFQLKAEPGDITLNELLVPAIDSVKSLFRENQWSKFKEQGKLREWLATEEGKAVEDWYNKHQPEWAAAVKQKRAEDKEKMLRKKKQQDQWMKEWVDYAEKRGRPMTGLETMASMSGPPPKKAHIDYSNELNLDYGGYQQPPQYQEQHYPYFDGYASSRRQDVMVLPPQSNGYYVMPPDQFAVGGMAPSYSAYQDNALLLVLLMLVLALFGCGCLCASAAIGWFSGRKSVQDRGSKVWSPIAQEVDEV